MILARVFYNGLRTIPIKARFYSKHQNPFIKTWDVISKEIPVMFGLNKKPVIYPEHADVVIIGGGFIGSSVAYWLKLRAGDGLSIVVLEKDPTYQQAYKNLGLGTITQHYTLPENMLLSQFGADFMRNINKNLNTNVNIQYCPRGHLVLASEKYAEKLEENVSIQKEYGIRSELLTVDNIKMRYPWINTQDIRLGSLGIESEGTFNPWALLKGLVNKSEELGTTYVHAEMSGFELEQQHDVLMEGIEPGSYKKINRVLYKTPDNEEHALKFAVCILASGDKSGEIAKLAKVGTGDGLLHVPLPVYGREHKIYSIEDSALKTGLDTPIITDTSGIWLTKNGLENNLICGHAPLLDSDATDSLADTIYNRLVKPSIINRIPDCKDSKVDCLNTELYDYCTYDDMGILGPHPYHNNLFIAAGFGKQGCAQAPGIGRAIAELVIDSQFINIDLTRLTFDRLLTNHPLYEFNIY